MGRRKKILTLRKEDRLQRRKTRHHSDNPITHFVVSNPAQTNLIRAFLFSHLKLILHYPGYEKLPH